MRAWLATHQVAGFVLLAFGISYLIGLPMLLMALSVVTSWGMLESYVPRILVVFGPGIAALILAHSARRDGVTRLLRSLLPIRADLAWVVGILVTSAITSALALQITGVSSADALRNLRAHGHLLLAHFALQLFVVAIGEELGWRGWLLPALAERATRLRATLVTAAIWTLWHGPLLVTDLTTTTMFVLGVLGLSVVFTWMWERTGRRLFIVVVAHAAVNAPVFFWNQVSVPTNVGANGWGVWYSLEAMYAAGGLALLILRWSWWTAIDVRGHSDSMISHVERARA